MKTDDDAFHAEADARWQAFLVDGMTISWDEARTWLEMRARGEDAPHPIPRQREG